MAATATMYKGTFHGRTDQVRAVRQAVASYVSGCPRADDIVLVASEFSANAVLHSDSKGQFFTVRCQLYPDYAWIECEDLGGPWHREPEDDRPHGLDIIHALTGPDNWGVETTGDGDRIVWARLDLPQETSDT